MRANIVFSAITEVVGVLSIAARSSSVILATQHGPPGRYSAAWLRVLSAMPVNAVLSISSTSSRT
jgi:hypothetical protein